MSFLAEHGFLILAVLAAGVAAGFAGGLFGIGGGIVTVPALYAVFHSYNIAEGPSLKTAIGTSLAVIIATSLASLSAHRRAGQVDMRILKAWGPWIAAGSAAGGLLARYVPGEALAIVFALGAGWIGWRRLFGARGKAEERPDLTERRIHIPIGIGTGLFSSLMGLGGGAVGVMVMTWSGRSIHQAVATASGFGVAVAVPGALGFALSGFGQRDLPPFSLGFVNLPAFLAMAAMSALAAPAGARLAHRMKGDLLSKLFGVYVLAAALAILVDVVVS
jgi:uncharacterized membrane protein YfcA